MQRLGKALCALATGLVVSVLLASWAHAQTWPQRPVRFIVSLGPGSGADITARLLADRLTTKWKQPVVVENRPGGDAVVAITAFIGAKDDHTLLFTPTSSFTAHPYQHAKMPYDPNELSPIARATNTLVGFVVPAASKVGSVKEFVDLVRAEPGKINYSTATGMTDVIFEGFFKAAGLSITRVPYRDVVSPLTDLGEGRIQMYIGALGIVQPHIQSGRIKLVAVTNTDRAPNWPNIPTVAQAGFPDMTFDGLSGLFGPRDMPNSVRDRIAADFKEILSDPAVASRLTATGQLVSPGTAQEFAAALEKQRVTLAAVAKRLGVKPQ